MINTRFLKEKGFERVNIQENDFYNKELNVIFCVSSKKFYILDSRYNEFAGEHLADLFIFGAKTTANNFDENLNLAVSQQESNINRVD